MLARAVVGVLGAALILGAFLTARELPTCEAPCERGSIILRASAPALLGLFLIGMSILIDTRHWRRADGHVDLLTLRLRKKTRDLTAQREQSRQRAADNAAHADATRAAAEHAAREAAALEAEERAEAADPAYHHLRARLARAEIAPDLFNELRAHLRATRPRYAPPAPAYVPPPPRALTAGGVFWAIVGALLFVGLLGWLFMIGAFAVIFGS
jgi:hypothetical protein